MNKDLLKRDPMSLSPSDREKRQKMMMNLSQKEREKIQKNMQKNMSPEQMKMKQAQMGNAKQTKEEDKVNHQEVILDKLSVKKRNELNKDYSKMFSKTRNSGRGPGRGMYLGGKAKNTKGTVTRVIGYLGNHFIGLIIVTIAIIVSTLLSLQIPLLFGNALDDHILTRDFDGAYVIAAQIIVIAIITSIIRFVSKYTMTIISQKTIKNIRKDAFDNLQKLPVKYYDDNQTGDIVSRLSNDIDLINVSLASTVIELIRSVVTLIGAAIMMFIISWSLAIIVIVFVPIMVFITLKISKTVRKGFMAQQKHLGGLNSIVEESIAGLKVVKLYNQEQANIEEFKEKNINLRDAGFKVQVRAGLIMPIVTFMNNFIYLTIVAVGGFLYITYEAFITIGNISAITQYARQFVQPISNLAQLFNSLQQGIAGAERVFELIDEETEYVNDGTLDVDSFEGVVEFDNVTFEYVEGKTVLSNVSFKANRGEIVAIVGPTGSGKTTLINLLNRFYDPIDGVIKVDGKNINEYKKDAFRKRIGVVLQDTSLFSGTVYDNIHYGDKDTSREKVMEAAKLANAYDFIMKLPKGFETEVYEGGQNFSHGERQLVSIARTILSNPDILILDEATSNVDTRTEKRIQESMKTLMRNRTSFVIAHRLQTIKNSDKIIVIKEGKLIEEGHHDDLLKQQGFYYDLYTTQFKSAKI
ncbi:MAG: ABC transporter ATP-binding protein [Candidatus Izemoplasma sp.]